MKTAWQTNTVYKNAEESFTVLSKAPPSVEELHYHMSTIERFVVLMYDRFMWKCRWSPPRNFYSQSKGNSANPTNLRSSFSACQKSCISGRLCMGPVLLRAPELPNASDWGWTKRTSDTWEPLWKTLPEACKSCQELIKCGSNVDKGRRGRCKCVKAGVACRPTT